MGILERHGCLWVHFSICECRGWLVTEMALAHNTGLSRFRYARVAYRYVGTRQRELARADFVEEVQGTRGVMTYYGRGGGVRGTFTVFSSCSDI